MDQIKPFGAEFHFSQRVEGLERRADVLPKFITSLDFDVDDSTLVAFDLIPQISGSSADLKHLTKRIYETLPSYGSMKTFENRFVAVDEEILKIVTNLSETKEVVRIHDMAASNAITTVELFRRLSHIPNIEVCGSDVCTEIDVTQVGGAGAWRIIKFNRQVSSRRWIQAINRSVVVNAFLPLRKSTWLAYCFNKLMAMYVSIFVVGKQDKPKLPNNTRSISLFHKEALELASRDVRFKLLRYNILSDHDKQRDVVRIMTLLFPELVLRKAIGNVCKSIADHGFLIIGYGGKECSFFRRKGQYLKHWADVGKKPSRLKDIIGQIKIE
jgi:hypothetical protein